MDQNNATGRRWGKYFYILIQKDEGEKEKGKKKKVFTWKEDGSREDKVSIYFLNIIKRS